MSKKRRVSPMAVVVVRVGVMDGEEKGMRSE